jgi:adenylate kinase
MSNVLYIVFLGPPGAGKGTQAVTLAEKLGIAHVSSGDLFRYNLREGTELGKLAKSYMDKGELVPDEVTISMVMDRLAAPDCALGAILDGFPRTLPQARALDDKLAEQGQQVSVAPLVQVGDEQVMERLTGRRVCRDCGAVYHLVFNPPAKENVCATCGGELYQRDDDRPETVRFRLYTYYKETGPLIGYYYALGSLVEVDGAQPIAQVQADLHAAVVSRATLADSPARV